MQMNKTPNILSGCTTIVLIAHYIYTTFRIDKEKYAMPSNPNKC